MMLASKVTGSIFQFRHLLATLGVLITLAFLFYLHPSKIVIVVSNQTSNGSIASNQTKDEPAVPPTLNYCCAVCIQDKKNRLMEVRDVALIESVPVAQCDSPRNGRDKKAPDEWNPEGHCSTMCVKDAMGNLRISNQTCELFPLCRKLAQPDLDFNVKESMCNDFCSG